MPRPAPDVIHIGSASRDLAADDPRGWRLGGGVTYASLTTARLGLATAALIGVDRHAARAAELDTLRAAGVDVRLVRLAESPVFVNIETPTGRVQIAVAPGVPLRPRAVPVGWRAARAWSVVPVAREVDDDWAAVVPAGAFVAVGWQGLLRTLTAGQRVERRAPAPSALLRRADLVGVSEQDLAPGTDPLALVELLRPGARLVVTRGAAGGTVIDIGSAGADGPPRTSTYAAQQVSGEADPTGAGDTFLAALMAAAIRPALLGDAASGRGADLRFAAAAASLAVRATGTDGIGDRDAVMARLRHEAAGGA